ncbi:hypothetical protein GCM10022215_04770 [Nocardioides fonticola]|uniref:Uncharacterized protein n=1 Tax=Nocardioides fonticola TaxID=450363 RepID=A0ABP7XBN1_9ACTN
MPEAPLSGPEGTTTMQKGPDADGVRALLMSRAERGQRPWFATAAAAAAAASGSRYSPPATVGVNVSSRR